MPTASVIVRTYNAPRELDLVLEGLARQSVMPIEVVVADDGSGVEVRGVLKRWEHVYSTKFLPISHEDMGFRKSLISNKAVARTSGDELLFIDADAVPHREWVADHLAAAGMAEVRCGRRVKLGPNFSPKVDCEVVRSGALESLLGPVFRYAVNRDTQRFLLSVRLPSVLARVLHPRPLNEVLAGGRGDRAVTVGEMISASAGHAAAHVPVERHVPSPQLVPEPHVGRVELSVGDPPVCRASATRGCRRAT